MTSPFLDISQIPKAHPMDFLLYLLVAYGITFGMQHKALFLRNKSDWVDRMLACTYCTGFHAGWIAWCGWKLKMIFENPMSIFGITLVEMFLFALASAGFSYFLDTLIRLMESHADPIDLVDEEAEGDEKDQEVE
jgi:hypothetical protein